MNAECVALRRSDVTFTVHDTRLVTGCQAAMLHIIESSERAAFSTEIYPQ